MTTAAPPRGSAATTDRDLSWLDFDRRVLELSADARRPLAERLKLFAIVASNLDEFFAVRVARLWARDDERAQELLALVRSGVLELQAAQDSSWRDDLQPALAAAGVRILAGRTAWEREGAAEAYERTVASLIRTTRLGASTTAPTLESGQIAVAACSRDDAGRVACALARVPRGTRFVCVAGDWLFVDEGVAGNAAALLPGRPVDAVATLRVTRSAELPRKPEDAGPRSAVEQQLVDRRYGSIVRLELGAGAPEWVADTLRERLGLAPDQVYRPTSAVGLADLRHLAGTVPLGAGERPSVPVVPPAFATADPDELFRRIRDRTRLVHHPYESFEHSVQAFAAASRDAGVTELAATVYRTSRPSGTLAALVDTAAAGKHALCLVELRARFDERQNLEWSRALDAAGVEVVHGPDALKVHAKLMLISREEAGGTRRYAHIGTGNYHAWNAFGYEDLSLFTADEDLTEDVARLFAAIAGRERSPRFRRLLVAPWTLRAGLTAEIAATAAAARAGLDARIRIKVNALGDGAVVRELYEAARAGVEVDLIVRGVCTLVPGVDGTAGRIRVRSVLGRFLEHSRIFSFEVGDEQRTWLGSADLLTRNLDLRVEALVPVDDPSLQLRLGWILDTLLADTSAAWALGRDGSWRRVEPPAGTPPVSAQDVFAALAPHGSDSR